MISVKNLTIVGEKHVANVKLLVLLHLSRQVSQLVQKILNVIPDLMMMMIHLMTVILEVVDSSSDRSEFWINAFIPYNGCVPESQCESGKCPNW